MPHSTPLVATIVAGLVLAFVFGALANRLRLSPLVGYLVAGVLIGPATPGYVADLDLAPQLAEIGVVLLMFGVGLHFSLDDLLSVSAISVPGAIAQIAAASLLGLGLALWLGGSLGAGLVFGLALSVASTVVLLRALEERRLLETTRGRIAVGWLIVEDLAMIVALVLLPVIAELLAPAEGGASAELGAADIIVPLASTFAQVAVFVTLMLVVGRRAIPWVLHRIAGTGSRELFTLAVLAVALGIAFGAAELFGVSFALGAFFAGMVLAGSELSHRAAADSLPLRDAFAVLFFVSVGMLFDPAVFVEYPRAVAATVFIIVVGKSVAAYAIVRLFGHPHATALIISASLAQIGEFSFILAALGTELGLLNDVGQDLILAGAITSIVLNPLVFAGAARLARTAPATPPASAPTVLPAAPAPAENEVSTELTGHTVIAGCGTVGRLILEGLQETGQPFVVIDDNQDNTEGLRAAGTEAITGNAAHSDILDAANITGARWLFVAIPNVFEAGQVVEKARRLNPDIRIVARAERPADAEHLLKRGADTVTIGRRELALAMLDEAGGEAAEGRETATLRAGP